MMTLALCLLLQDERALTAEGTVEFNGKKFAVRGAYATYYKNLHLLKLTLTSFEFTEEEERALKDPDGNAAYEIVDGIAKRPGEDGFETAPVLELDFDVKEGAESLTAETVSAKRFRISGLTGAPIGMKEDRPALEEFSVPVVGAWEKISFNLNGRSGELSLDEWKIDVKVKTRIVTYDTFSKSP